MSPYDLSVMRELLENSFTAEELEIFAFDHFHDVYRQFTTGQTMGARVRMLIDHAETQGTAVLSQLLQKIKEVNPNKYQEYEARLSLKTGPLPLSHEISYSIPVPVVSNFIGRELELTAYRNQLSAERLAIITGMVGIGKTTLGAKLAREMADHEEDIFWFTFNQHTNNTSEALLWALAAFLDGRGWSESWRYLNGEIETHRSLNNMVKLTSLLRGLLTVGNCVICLDDFDVVKDDPGILEFFHFVRENGRNSRGELPAFFIIIAQELPSEMEYMVSKPLFGLSEADTKAFLESSSMQLPEDILHLLWNLTEGNPVLLGLSASELQSMDRQHMTPDELIKSMANEANVRDFLMNNILARLSLEEKETLNALSIFPGSVKQEAIRAILAAAGIHKVTERIAGLVNKWVVNEATNGYLRLPALVREYCYQILEPEEKEHFHSAAAAYFLEHEEYVMACYHHLERGAYGEAINLLSDNAQVIVNAGGAGALLQQLDRFRWPALTQSQKAALYQIKGDAFRVQGKYEQALEAYEIAKQYIKKEDEQAKLLYGIGLAFSMGGNYEGAIESFQQSIDLYENLHDHAGKTRAQCAFAWAQYRLGRSNEAGEQFKICWDAGQEMGDDVVMARASLGLGLLAWAKEDLRGSQKYFERSLDIFRNYGDAIGEVQALTNLGLVFSSKEEFDQVLTQYQNAMNLAEKVGDVHTLRVILNNIGDVYQKLKDFNHAIDYYEQLARLARDTGHKPMLSTAEIGLADAHLALADQGHALDCAQEALRVAQETGPSVELAASYRVLGDVWLAKGDALTAKDYFEKSIPLLTELEEDEELSKAQHGLEMSLASRGNNN